MTNRQNNIVYWIVDGLKNCVETTVEPAVSDNWSNKVFSHYGEGGYLEGCEDGSMSPKASFKDRVDAVSEALGKDRPTRYAVVTDEDDPVNLATLYGKVVSNNVVCFKRGEYDRDKVGLQIKWILSDFGRDSEKGCARVWFTSDTHFNHANIIRYCDRPWHGKAPDPDGNIVVTEDDVKRMNETIIGMWNARVGENDVVWHLGDFCLGKDQRTAIPEFVSRLKGHKRIVLGNHDRHGVKFYYDAGFEAVYDRTVLWNGFYLLSHSPIEFVKPPFVNIAGHVHNCPSYKTWSKDSCNVCVERHGYAPVSFDEIRRKLDSLNDEDYDKGFEGGECLVSNGEIYPCHSGGMEV